MPAGQLQPRLRSSLGAPDRTIAAGTLLIVGQAIWWPFDQQKNLATAQNDIFNAGSVIYFCGFCVLMLPSSVSTESRPTGLGG